MKDPLRKDFIAVSGDFGEERSHEKIKRWIEVNGGKYESSITDRTTHLICSKSHWKRRAKMGTYVVHLFVLLITWLASPDRNGVRRVAVLTVSTVKAARKSKHVKIVTFDWLEDSLQNQTHKREGAYLWKKIVERKEIKKARRRQRERKGERDDSKTSLLSYLPLFAPHQSSKTGAVNERRLMPIPQSKCSNKAVLWPELIYSQVCPHLLHRHPAANPPCASSSKI